MGKTVRLRVSDKIVITQELLKNLEKILGTAFVIEASCLTRSQKDSNQRRINAYYEAFLLLPEVLPELTKYKESLTMYADYCKDVCVVTSDETSQQTLVKFTQLLVNCLMDCMDWKEEDPQKAAIELLNLADQYVTLLKGRLPLATLSVCRDILVLQKDTPLLALHEDTIKGLNGIREQDIKKQQGVRLAEWFTCLSVHEQALIRYCLKRLDTVEAIFGVLSSRTRSIPGLANFLKREFILLNLAGDVLQHNAPRYSSSHVGSRDVKSESKQVIEYHTQHNGELIHRLAGDKPLLLQTLVSPNVFLGLNTIVSVFMPDPYLDKQRLYAVKVLEEKGTIISTNHALNLARIYDSTSCNNESCLKLLKIAKEGALKQDYERLLNSKYGSGYLTDYHGRELYLSSYEDLLMVDIDGISYGSCVSGKDRKAIQLMHTFSMILYAFFYKKWPSYFDQGQARADFVNLFCDLYETWHMQYASEDNAKGACGLKHQKYLPWDIVQEIKRRHGDNILKIDDRLASNNETASICKDELLKGYGGCVMAALQLGEQPAEEFMNILYPLITEDKFWQEKKSKLGLNFMKTAKEAPEGILKIRKIALWHLQKKPVDYIGCMADIYSLIKHQIKPSWLNLRADTTQQVYSCIFTLFESKNPRIDYIEQIQCLTRIKEEMQDKNKSPVFNN